MSGYQAIIRPDISRAPIAAEKRRSDETGVRLYLSRGVWAAETDTHHGLDGSEEAGLASHRWRREYAKRNTRVVFRGTALGFWFEGEECGLIGPCLAAVR